MIRATLADVDKVNSYIGRDFEGVDFTEVIAEPLHVCLLEGDSGAVFAWRGPGIYEAHLFFAVKGRAALDLIAQMIEVMRRDYGARMFWALIPVESRKVTLFARWVGWASRGELMTKDGPKELFVSEKVECLL